MYTLALTETYTVITHTLSGGAVMALEYRATAGEVGVMTMLVLAVLVLFNFRWIFYRK